jgi:GNAT superfamily N-acetyltransferase
MDAHQEDDFQNLFSYLPADGFHVLAFFGDQLVGHAVATISWLQAGDLPLLRTAYVDAVATSPQRQGRGVGRAVMRHLASVLTDYEIACLETERRTFYEHLGWEEWRGPLAGPISRGLDPNPEPAGHHDPAAAENTTPRSRCAADDRGPAGADLVNRAQTDRNSFGGPRTSKRFQATATSSNTADHRPPSS